MIKFKGKGGDKMNGSSLKKHICLLIIFSMLTGIFSPIVPGMITAKAGDDAQECWHCGHIHWGDYLCDCGACSLECTNSQCFVDTHCNACGACLSETVWCEEYAICEDCYVNNGWHCLGCGDCYCENPEDLCGICWFCESCMGAFCDDCGFCETCQGLDGGVHCTECGNCYATHSLCKDGNEHCEECCLICEACDMCVYEEGLELCEECGKCKECCEFNTASEGCDCGEYCVEQSDWYDHLCAECGTPFCQSEMCDICGYCLNCCESASECEEYMCVADDEYDTHFCEDCGECFHNVNLCENCNNAGELRCEDCCRAMVEEEGCDCDDRCINDDDFEEHINSFYGNSSGYHELTIKNTWEFDDTAHWRNCRYCAETEHTKIGISEHSYNNYGICKICGFNSKSKILILQQPKSRYAIVTDHNASKGEPYNIEDNKVSFTMAAKGLSELTYQWYYRVNSGEWYELTDNTNSWYGYDYEFYTVFGSKSNKLTITVPEDACYSDYSYKCVVTDESGNQQETVPAMLKAAHEKGKYIPLKDSELKNIIHQPDNNNNIGVYDSIGHENHCLGDGCEYYKVEPHHYSRETKIIIDSQNGNEWIERTCVECELKVYELKHDHYFVDSETGDISVDYTYENTGRHKLKCLHNGCDKTTYENHTYSTWNHMGTPYTQQDGVGIPYRECMVCSYQNENELENYDIDTSTVKTLKWDLSNDLVSVLYGNSSSDIVEINDKLYITFEPSAYDKKEYIKKTNPKCTGWKVYYVVEKTLGSSEKKDVTQYFTMTKVAGEPRWNTTIKSFTGYTGGGIFVFEPIISDSECTHSNGTRIVGAYEPVCVREGYTGDKVCADCGYVVAYGESIDSYGEHQGELTLIQGTTKEGTCETRGYEGTYRCSHCKMKVKGKSTSKVHKGEEVLVGEVKPSCFEFGYSGDTYCDCGALLHMGHVTLPEHVSEELVGYIAPTASSDGYSGDRKCTECDTIIKYGYTLRKENVITDINISDLELPIAGETPDYNVTTSGKGWHIDKFGVSHVRNGISWVRENGDVNLHPNDKFIRGYDYCVSIRVEADRGYYFSGELAPTINGMNVTYMTVEPGYIILQYSIWCAQKHVSEIQLSGIDLPYPGNSPSYNVTVDRAELYCVDEVYWMENGEGMIIGEDEFKEGYNYSIGIGLCPVVTYGSEQCVFDNDIVVYVDGKKAIVSEVREDYIYFTCNAAQFVKIMSQPEGSIIADGNAFSVSVDARGDGLTYQWYKKTKGSTTFVFDSNNTGKTFKGTMNSALSGCQLYCVITDKYGNSKKTDTVSLDAIYTVKYNANGGKCSTSIAKVTDGDTIYSLPTPTRTGYKFTGWYTAKTGGNKVTATTKITKSMTLYARWEIVNPSQVTGFTYNARTATTVSLKWTKGSADTIGYEIWQYKGSGWTKIKTITDRATVSYKVTGLSASVSYKFKIRAYKTNGSSKLYSAYTTKSVKTLPATLKGFTYSARTATTVSLKWNKTNSADGYVIQQYKGGKWTTIKTITKNSTVSYKVSKLKPSTSYNFRIRAYKKDGTTKVYGAYVSKKVMTTPSSVKSFTYKARTKTTITLKWAKNTSASGYVIQQYKGGKWTTIKTITKNSTVSYKVSNLKKNTSYKFRIKAYKTSSGSKIYGVNTTKTIKTLS